MAGTTGTVQSIERAFTVLRQVAAAPGGISDIARAVDLPVSTVARLLATLESLDAVVRDGDPPVYAIGPGVRDLAGAASGDAALVDRARPVLAALVAQTGETAGISVRDGHEVVYLDHVETANEVTLRDWTGARLPLHCVSSGLVLLAGAPPDVVDDYVCQPLRRFTARTTTQATRLRRRLAQVRRDGTVWTTGEFDDGITSVAAAVVDAHGATVAALHCHGPSYRFPGSGDVAAITAHVVGAARTLGAMLPPTAGRPHPYREEHPA
jgi:DNA-binding IclR family transcriptional regulator